MLSFLNIDMKKIHFTKYFNRIISNFNNSGAIPDSFPKEVHFAITNRCNLNCEFCGQNQKKWSKNDELTFEQYREIIDQVSTMPETTVSFGGGEIFSHHQMDKILKYCSQKRVPINMVLTNGTLLNEDRINLLIDCKVNFVGFSIDGREETHDAIRGMRGAYKKTVYAIKKMQEMKRLKEITNPTLGINFVITNKNIGDMEAVVELATELEINSLRFSYLNYITEKKLSDHRKYMKYRYSDFDFCYWEGFENNNTAIDSEKLSTIIKKIKNHAGNKPKISFSYDMNKHKIHQWYNSDDKIFNKCGFFSCFFVLPNGDFPLCDFVRYPIGNVKEKSLEELWDDRKARDFRRTLNTNLIPGCERCCSVME